MGKLDVDSLFTTLPLEETIEICANTLFENTENTYFIFNTQNNLEL